MSAWTYSPTDLAGATNPLAILLRLTTSHLNWQTDIADYCSFTWPAPSEPLTRKPLKAKPVALITGATSGIGEATAYRLQDKRLHRVRDRPQPGSSGYTLRAKGLTGPLSGCHGRGRRVDCNSSRRSTSEHGGVDVLVNSAGYPLPRPLEQVALDELRKLFETNVVATLHLSQAVLPGDARAPAPAGSSRSAAPAGGSPARAPARITR